MEIINNVLKSVAKDDLQDGVLFIPDSVTVIASDCCKGLPELHSIEGGKNVKLISAFAFAESGLSEIPDCAKKLPIFKRKKLDKDTQALMSVFNKMSSVEEFSDIGVDEFAFCNCFDMIMNRDKINIKNTPFAKLPMIFYYDGSNNGHGFTCHNYSDNIEVQKNSCGYLFKFNDSGKIYRENLFVFDEDHSKWVQFDTKGDILFMSKDDERFKPIISSIQNILAENNIPLDKELSDKINSAKAIVCNENFSSGLQDWNGFNVLKVETKGENYGRELVGALLSAVTFESGTTDGVFNRFGYTTFLQTLIRVKLPYGFPKDHDELALFAPGGGFTESAILYLSEKILGLPHEKLALKENETLSFSEVSSYSDECTYRIVEALAHKLGDVAILRGLVCGAESLAKDCKDLGVKFNKPANSTLSEEFKVPSNLLTSNPDINQILIASCLISEMTCAGAGSYVERNSRAIIAEMEKMTQEVIDRIGAKERSGLIGLNDNSKSLQQLNSPLR
ncbi:MAG: hypothetical protein LBM38_03520 [Clostridiales bacterium]|jgi:hypothetical protein|nr:hypothetical protein [Clostridiales bacterium]